ncbi:MAG: hypothetical protein IPH12_06670 [Saprospirales bacterium]|jgi:hypothetical protein|nr:hypothetical protein [Saprospirales bacterium]MBK8923306.1 hypothetical protein [Saprospirales bacterium]
MKRFTFSLLALLLLGACAQYYYTPAGTQPGQTEAVYTRGLPGLRSQQYGADLTAGLSAKGENDLALQVYLYNDSDSAYTFYPEDVRVSGYDAFGHMQPLRVFEASEYKKWKRNRDILIGTAVVVGTVALILVISELSKDNNKKSSRNNNAQNHNEWANFYYYDPIGWIDFSFHIAYAAGTHGAPPPQSEPRIPEDGLLRAHTIYPGEAIQGIIKVRGKSNFMERLLVEMPVNGAYHKFAFDNRQRAR